VKTAVTKRCLGNEKHPASTTQFNLVPRLKQRICHQRFQNYLPVFRVEKKNLSMGQFIQNLGCAQKGGNSPPWLAFRFRGDPRSAPLTLQFSFLGMHFFPNSVLLAWIRIIFAPQERGIDRKNPGHGRAIYIQPLLHWSCASFAWRSYREAKGTSGARGRTRGFSGVHVCRPSWFLIQPFLHGRRA